MRTAASTGKPLACFPVSGRIRRTPNDMENNSIQEKTKILVVDDERLIRLMFGAKLRAAGYEAVCVASTAEAVSILKQEDVWHFGAIVSDIRMDEMDGFVFRDILRGLDATIPVFFLTALDPEEGSGFLRRIMEDPHSFYLPKSVATDTLVRRVQGIVAARRMERFLDRQNEATKKTLGLASIVQRSMLPPLARMDETTFYSVWWHPKDAVSGDLFETAELGGGRQLYVLGDVQGHGTSAALSMMAVQSFLKQIVQRRDLPRLGPADVATELHRFFENNLNGVSYMTALICRHDPETRTVDWISCGAPDLAVVDPASPDTPETNPEKRGGLPIGLVPEAVYSEADVVRTELSETAVCVAHTDGILDLAKDAEGYEQMPSDLRRRLRNELLSDARLNGSIIASPHKFMAACEAYGYGNLADDVTELVFGSRILRDDLLQLTVPVAPGSIDEASEKLGAWCDSHGLGPAVSSKVQVVFAEKMMNLHDHGIDVRDRARAVAGVRLRGTDGVAELTVWDNGVPEPSIAVVTGDPDVAFELKNREFSGRGRGRLLVRKMCDGIYRNRFGHLNETTYLVPPAGGDDAAPEETK